MKVSLQFNIPEEEEEFRITIDAYKYKGVIQEFDNWLRDLEKNDTEFLRIGYLRETLYRMVNDRDITMD